VRFACQRTLLTSFPDFPYFDFMPMLGEVRLLTVSGRFARTAGRERLWRALWDTGGAISVVPHAFIEEVGCQPSGKTRTLRAFDRNSGHFPWYHVLIGIPGLALFRARVIAPEDEDPRRPRRHITLGRDIISRLTLRCDSTLPWDIEAVPDADSNWTWEYERRPA